jgi:alpha-tubulin suppressor-like RCC1 family protein
MIPFARIGVYGNKIPIIEGLKKFVTMFNNMYLLNHDGNLYAIGSNANGLCGLPSTVTQLSRWTLVQTNVSDIWVNNQLTALISKTDGTFMYTGRDLFLGTNKGAAYGFTDCTSLLGSAGTYRSSLTLTGYNIFYIDGGSNLYGMGYNNNGSLGTGNTTPVQSFRLLATNVKKVVGTLTGDSTSILKNDGSVYGCGENSNYQLGFTSPARPNVFTESPNAAGAIDLQMAHSSIYVLKSDGLYTGGTSFSGQLGNGINANTNVGLARRNIPGTITGFVANNYSCMIYSSGNYYITGQNSLSGTSTENVSTPTLVPSSYIKDIGIKIEDIQFGYRVLYGVLDKDVYGSGIGSGSVLLPYYTGAVTGMQKLGLGL